VKSATLPLPMENNPQIVFQRFGDGTSAQRQERRNQAEPARFASTGALAREGPAGR
jgi:hypothetical protein